MTAADFDALVVIVFFLVAFGATGMVIFPVFVATKLNPKALRG